MKKLLMSLAALALIASPAIAAEQAATNIDPLTGMTVAAKETTLKDGTKLSIEGDSVFVVAADGAKTPAPDGTHELADGTKVTTAAGKIVPEAK